MRVLLQFVIIKESGIDPTRHPAPLDVASISHADMMLVMPYWRDPAIDILSHQISKLCTIVRKLRISRQKLQPNDHSLSLRYQRSQKCLYTMSQLGSRTGHHVASLSISERSRLGSADIFPVSCCKLCSEIS